MSGLINAPSPWATQYTRTGTLDMSNRKPFRTKAQKAEARRTYYLASKDGAYHSTAPVSYHKRDARRTEG